MVFLFAVIVYNIRNISCIRTVLPFPLLSSLDLGCSLAVALGSIGPKDANLGDTLVHGGTSLSLSMFSLTLLLLFLPSSLEDFGLVDWRRADLLQLGQLLILAGVDTHL